MGSEETEPLTSVPPRRVAEAYKSGGTVSVFKKFQFGFMALAFVILLMFGSGGDDDLTPDTSKNLRSQAEQAPTSVVQKQPEFNSNNIEFGQKIPQLNTADAYANAGDVRNDYNDDEAAEEELELEVEAVMDEVDEAEEEEIAVNDSMLVSAVKNVEDNVKFYLGKVFGSDEEGEDEAEDDDAASEDSSKDVKLSGEQLDDIAKKISEKLEEEVKTEFRAKADEIAEEKVSEIGKVLSEDRDAGMDAGHIAEDVAEAEKVVEVDLKDEIDEAAKKVKDQIPEKVKKIRNEVVEEVTGKKLDDIVDKQRAKRAKMKEKFKELKEAKAKADMEAAAKKYSKENDAMKRNYEQDEDMRKPDSEEVLKSKTMPIDDKEEEKKESTPKSLAEQMLKREESVSKGKVADLVDLDAVKPDREEKKTEEEENDGDEEATEEKKDDDEETSTADLEPATVKKADENTVNNEEQLELKEPGTDGNKTSVELARRDEEYTDDDEE